MKITIAVLVAAAVVAGAGRHKIVGKAKTIEPAVTASKDSPPPTLPPGAAVLPTVIGMNVTGLSFFSSENALYDLIRNHGFIGINGPKFTSNWVDLADQVPRDSHGGLLHVPKDTGLIVHAGDALLIGSKLQCHLSPGWQVSALMAYIAQDGSNFVVTPDKNAKPTDSWSLILHANNDNIALTELSCRSPAAAAGAVFRPEFLADMKPFGIVRFMDWMRTNAEPETRWASRPKPDDMSYIAKGMPVEIMVELANQLHSDPWFTLPFDADDEYQRNFATYVRDHLAPDLKAYAELSNEVWNNSFPQSKQATALGKARYPSEDDAHATDYYYGDRVRHMMAIWSEVFAGQKQRLVRVASSQAAWPARSEFVLGHADTAKSVDVLAIAPYFGGMPFDVPGTGAARVDGIFERMPKEIEGQIAHARQAKAIALKYGLRLVTYEAGTAYDAYTPEMMKDVQAVLHDPRLAPLYQSYLTRWAREVGGEMVLYNTVGGVWGHLERTGQPWHEMPKMAAVANVIASLPQGQQRGVKAVTP
jgi:hypothetical protein